jgi:superfamily II DNA or RNA helicase
VAHRLSIYLKVDGEIEIPPGDALERIHQPLHNALTFENMQWRRKVARGLSADDIPRYRSAYYKLEDGSWRVARGAWRIIRDIAQQHKIELMWESRVIHASERQAEFNFSAELRPYQKSAVEALLRAKSGVIVIPTGGGKTMVALAVAAALKTRTLFIVHTRELLQQICQSAQSILGVKAGILGAGNWRPAPFTAALIQTLARRDLSDLRNEFGLIVVDEAHHAPAQSYCQILPSFPARHRIALTATPYRKDGLHELLWLQFGEIVYSIGKRDLEQHGRLMSPEFYAISTEFKYVYDDDFTQMINALCRNRERHRLVIETIAKTHRTGGCSLVLTERIEHATRLYQALCEAQLPVVLLHGKLSTKIREQAMSKLQNGETEILVATLSLIGEGWDHPPLDTLYLTVPNGNRTKTIQALGRILRPYPDKPTPRVYDFVDYQVGILRHHWMIRSRAYGLDPEVCRAALKLPPNPAPPAPPSSPSISSSQIPGLFQAMRQGDFDAARNILQAKKHNNIDQSTTKN